MPAGNVVSGVRASEKSKSTRCKDRSPRRWTHTEIVGFQIAMRHTFAFQYADDFKQVVAEAVEEVEA